MGLFGKSNGGGRRRASREAVPMPALVSTVQQTRMAVLADVSATGARLRGANLPGAEEPVSVRMDCVRAFGIVAWSEAGECGVEFEPPLPEFEVERLRREVKVAALTSDGLEETLALEDWSSGFAR
ncbi:MAG TPA: PilZ domain-containing protein [Sphingomicrobium sp.]|nr:PilZ domain-containing protein [Sphingomicrobium sp.]